MSSSAEKRRPLDIGIVGTRGVPARYGGFESFARELSVRLIERGHSVTAYGRRHYVDETMKTYRGVKIRALPSIRTKYLETVTHTFLSILAAQFQPHDLLLCCNGVNAVLCWIPKLSGQKILLNVDGLERQRKKWNWLGKSFYRLNEFLATLLPDAIVSDAQVIQDYYWSEYGKGSEFIPYGAPVGRVDGQGELKRLGVREGQYLLYVSRLEPENNAHVVIRAYQKSRLRIPLLVVGDAPYGHDYIQSLKSIAAESGAKLTGGIYGQGYRELLSHCLCYIQASEVGGTHPALLEAMGAGCLVLANDTPENREVVGEAGLIYAFNDVADLAATLRQVASREDSSLRSQYGRRAQERVQRHYNWEGVVSKYEELFYRQLEE